MKKCFILLVCLLLCFSTCAFAAPDRIVDDADLFSAQEEESLLSMITDFQNNTGMDFVLYTSSQPHTKSLAAIADDFYDYGGYGFGENADGVLYFIDMYERTPYLSTTGKMIDYMTDARIDASHDSAYPFLVDGDYAGAAAQMICAVYGYWEKGIPEGQYRYDIVTGQRLTANHKALTGTEVLVSALIALVAALLFAKTIEGRYTLKGRTYYYDADSNSTVNMTASADDYIRTTTSRQPRVTSSSSGGGSGRSSGGSGVHRSSSGRSHGGGAGRKF